MKEEDETTRRNLTNKVLRAARELRDAARNLVRSDEAAKEAWKKLDEAINARDDGIVDDLPTGPAVRQ